MLRFDFVNVVDIECTCWRDRIAPPGEKTEIIEIGIAVIDVFNLKIVKSESIAVKPTRSTVSEFCTELTGWTQQALDQKGVSFEEACKHILKQYDSIDRPWISQGNGDRLRFEEQCPAMNVPYPFGPEHINMAGLMALLTGRKQQVGQAKALELLRVNPQGKAHSGKWDAFNLAQLFIAVLRRTRFAVQ